MSTAAFATATGCGVRVGVIDSGVNPAHPHISAIAGGVAVNAEGGVEEGESIFLDRLGHGTAVTAALQEKAPDAAYFAVKVFHTSLQCTPIALLGAIDWCIGQKMDVVNLSLGTTNRIYAESFAAAVARARAAGVLLVAARGLDDKAYYPGCLPGVIGVNLDWEWPRDSYRVGGSGDARVFHASGYPRPAPGVAPTRNLNGVSFAVANMAGFVARACEIYDRDMAIVEAALQKGGSVR